jgi:adenine-specific DNA-methyltransferase
MVIPDFVAYSYEQGKLILEKRRPSFLKEIGQFLTPPGVARFMARQLGEFKDSDKLLDPAIGSGVLICAVIERLIKENNPIEIFVTAYELDDELAKLSRKVLELASQEAQKFNITIHYEVINDDFIFSCLPDEQPSLFGNSRRSTTFTHIISNPPYFKVNADEKHVRAVTGKLNGHTNIYTMFMALSYKLLVSHGKACFIVPRSFCSGTYFDSFRRELLNEVIPTSIHLFHARDEIFDEHKVLQENIIFSVEKLEKRQSVHYWAGSIEISSSKNGQLLTQTNPRKISYKHFLSDKDGHYYFRLPVSLLDEEILDAIDQWDGSLTKYGMNVSTGRIVPFRVKKLLKDHREVGNGVVPLLWMQNVKPYEIDYPIENLKKLQGVLSSDPSLITPCSNYVLVRRFSAKEDRRRLIAAPFLQEYFSCEQVGFENHINLIFKQKGIFTKQEAIGLSAFLNSAIVDRYFRILNGNTQVNAGEIRSLPLPPFEIIIEIGKQVEGIKKPTHEKIDNLIFSILWREKLITEEFPLVQETRITMGKIEQAQEILESFGLPLAQQNEISALTLLALAQISEDNQWNDATNPMLRTHDILIEIKNRYGRVYAENSRETIRRKVLHQFSQAGIVIQNEDDPSRPTNSGLNNYMLSIMALNALRSFDSLEWDEKLDEFLQNHGRLIDLYKTERELNSVPLLISEEKTVKLSPGKHNELQSTIVSEFIPRFAKGTKLLYIGDTAKKIIVFERELLAALCIPISEHGKLTDIILYDETKKRLFMIEAVTAHGPVSPKRHLEMENILKNCLAKRIYITAFLDNSTFKKFIDDIAWETEVWIAETPAHMIHFNGEKFLKE